MPRKQYIKKIGSKNVPYMTQKHFVVLAEELAGDKIYYNSAIKYHEKLERMIKYCEASNEGFNTKTFTAHINKTYDALKIKLGVA